MTDEFWDWAPNAPKKIACDNADTKGLPYQPYGCFGCDNMKPEAFDDDGRITHFYCSLGHSTVQFTVLRSKASTKGGRRKFFVMYRTHEPRGDA